MSGQDLRGNPYWRRIGSFTNVSTVSERIERGSCADVNAPVRERWRCIGVLAELIDRDRCKVAPRCDDHDGTCFRREENVAIRCNG
jgi:hypothetical protein